MPEVIYVQDDESDVQSSSMGACAASSTSHFADLEAMLEKTVKKMMGEMQQPQRQQQAIENVWDEFDPYYACS